MCVNEMDIVNFVFKQATKVITEFLKESLRSKKLRRDFSESVKNKVLALQCYRCNYCNRILDMKNFDHINGDRSNNSIFNCQALCPNCHAKKTRLAKQ